MSTIAIIFTSLFGLLVLVHVATAVGAVSSPEWSRAVPHLVAALLAAGMVVMFAAPGMRTGAGWAVAYAALALVIAGEIALRARGGNLRVAVEHCGGAGCGACMAYMFGIGLAGVPGLTWALAGCCGLYGGGWLVAALRRSANLRRAVPQLVMGAGMAYMLAVMAPTHGTIGRHDPSPERPTGTAGMPANMPGMRM